LSNRFGPSLGIGLITASLLAGCGGLGRDWASVKEVTPPFLTSGSASDPALAADRHGRVALTWVTCDSLGQDLWLALSADSGVTFAAPVRVNPRAGSVSSGAENRPVPVFGPGGVLVVAWSERRDRDSLVCDLVVRASGDGGRTLGAPVVINDDAEDGRPAFHGFPALAFLPDGGVFAAWVDHRERARANGGEPAASIFYARSSDGGQSWSDNRALTSQACARCRPMAVADAGGMVAVAYRDAGDGLRDPAIAISRNHGISFALDLVLVPDDWDVDACPIDGPVLTVDDAGGGAYAWYTGAGSPA
jgi:hypothetical protein